MTTGHTSTRTGLEGVRVLEIAGGLGPAWAAKLFGDLGADVIRYETDHDLVRDRPFDVFRWLGTSKRSTTTDLDDLLAGADVVLHDLGPTAAARLGVAGDDLLARYPRLVVCALTPFGSTGPYADYVATELGVIHGSTWGNLSPGSSDEPDLPPLKAGGSHATLIAGTVAATTALAAFDRADRTGTGEYIDVTVLGAVARMAETSPAGALFGENDASRVGVKSLAPWNVYACEDGLMQFICVEQAQWESLRRIMGDPEWAQMEIFADNESRRANVDLLDIYLREWFATQRVDDLYVRGQEARVCVSPVSTMEQLERNAQFVARGFFAEDPGGTKLPGPGFTADHPWWRMRSTAPARGEHDGADWLPRTDTAPTPRAAAPGSLARPLDEVKVCDFSWIWAGPYCTQLLAHLGADVIRLESPAFLCLFRRLPFPPKGVELTPDTDGLFQIYNSDKRSLGIDLRNDAAKEVIRRMIAWCDVVVENFAVGTLADLGFSVEELRRINPDVIVTSLSGYGQDGPAAGYMAYGPVGGAVAGLYAATGYEGGAPRETGIATGDPTTGLTAAWAVVNAITARRRNGETARLDVAMVEAIAATTGELWMEYRSTGTPPGPMGNKDAGWAPHAVYRTTGDDEWVTVCCTDDAMWQALCGVVDPSLAGDPRFATAAGRKAAEDALDERIAAWCATRDRWEVTRALQAVGVAAFPSLSPLALWVGDPQMAAMGMLEQPEHAVTGVRPVPGVPWRLRNTPNGLRRAAPALGQHTTEVLTEVLGFSTAEVAALAAAGALPTA